MTATHMAGSTLDRLFETGGHFAQVKSRRHPSMRGQIAGIKANVEIFDLVKTVGALEAAKTAMTTLGREGKTVLFVGGKREVSDAIMKAAGRMAAPYVAGRWLGGTISNFTEIKKRIDRLADLTGKRDSGELAKVHTKLERVFIDREIARLEFRLGGIASLSRRPDALIIVDTRHEAHAVREAKGAGIPVIGIMSSDCNLKDAAYAIPVNDASRTTVSLVLDELVDAFLEGRKG